MTATGRLARLGRTLRWYAPAVAVFVAVIVAWELIVRALDVRAFILPPPTSIGTALVDNWGAGLVDGWVPQLHRVVFYGDHLQSTKELAILMGLKTIEAM